MRTLRTLTFIGLVCAVPFTVSAQPSELSDNTLRAAYCIGVLKYTLSNLGVAGAGCEKSANPEECRALGAELHNYFRDEYEGKRKRYANYVAVRSIGATSDHILMLGAVLKKGEADAQTKERAAESPAIKVCSSVKGDNEQVECIAKHDPTLANVMRCQHLPDQLPF